jgi:hypothetical protein
MMLVESRFSMTSTTTCFQRGPGLAGDDGAGAVLEATGAGGVVGLNGVVLAEDPELEHPAISATNVSAAQIRAAMRQPCPPGPEPKLTGTRLPLLPEG